MHSCNSFFGAKWQEDKEERDKGSPPCLGTTALWSERIPLPPLLVSDVCLVPKSYYYDWIVSGVGLEENIIRINRISPSPSYLQAPPFPLQIRQGFFWRPFCPCPVLSAVEFRQEDTHEKQNRKLTSLQDWSNLRTWLLSPISLLPFTFRVFR